METLNRLPNKIVQCRCQFVFIVAMIIIFNFWPNIWLFNSKRPELKLKALSDTSCQGRCGAAVDSTKPCQCNSACTRFNDCCSDYNTVCASGGTCATLTSISAELWTNDVNRLSGSDITVNYQTQVPDGTTADRSTQKFFTYVNEAKLNAGTYKSLIALLNNYEPGKGIRESVTATETQEETAFLDAVLATKVMDSLLKFLTCKGLVTSQAALRSALKKHWFELYARSGTSTTLDTCGFEHIIVGEYKDSNSVNGFHNWVSFYEKEKSGSLNYFGYVSRANPSIIGAAFSWNSHVKTLGSFFIGVSPEFELAVYSLCFFTNPGKACNISLNGSPVTIMSYSKDGHLATAYLRARSGRRMPTTQASTSHGAQINITTLRPEMNAISV
ncbi:unnamed protein product [Lymnaea stagnalis]|uniref:Uridylate-specific endoribonuclease n=1 Tax=Lymnaea stagnalis TaxID=6523 RepID=A0AAV2HWJ7_LYMST